VRRGAPLVVVEVKRPPFPPSRVEMSLVVGFVFLVPALGFIATPSSPLIRIMAAPPKMRSFATGVEVCADFGSAADFFVDNFWAPLTDSPLPDSSRAILLEAQTADFTKRYGATVGKRRLASRLLEKRDASGSRCGLTTVEMTLISRLEKVSMSGGEKILGDAISSMGPKQRRAFKGYSTGQLVTELLPDDVDLVPILSNLAVDLTRRRSGVGMKLCLAAEEMSREWGFPDIWLQVEKENLSARKLYEEKLGYKLEWETTQPALRISPDGAFSEIDVQMLTMSKVL